MVRMKLFDVSVGVATGIGGSIAMTINRLNLWAGEYMQLLTFVSLLVGIVYSIYAMWLGAVKIREGRRERALKHKRMEHEKAMAKIREKQRE